MGFANACFKAGVKKFILVSALGADAGSKIFYNRVKGQTEEDLKKIGFSNLVIFQPSLLLGYRAERRPAEKVAQVLSKFVGMFLVGPLAKVRPVDARSVAQKMKTVALADQDQRVLVISNEEI